NKRWARAGCRAQIRLALVPRTKSAVVCQSTSRTSGMSARNVSAMLQLLPPLIDHLLEGSQIFGAQVLVFQEVLEQQQRVAAEDALHEFAQGVSPFLLPAAHRQVHVGAAFLPVFEPTGFLQLLHGR